MQRLYRIIADLRAKGVAVIYISHKLEEVMTISDEVSVMRDGRMIGTWPTPALTIGQVITRMVGRDLTDRYPGRHVTPGEVLLEVDALTSPVPGSFRDVSFRLHRGEVLGIGGLVGAQRTEVVEAIFGLRIDRVGHDPGQRPRRGHPVAHRREAAGHGAADRGPPRQRRGAHTLGVRERDPRPHAQVREPDGHRGHEAGARSTRGACSAACASGRRRSRRRSRACRAATSRRCCFARWLLSDPEILILDEPTRGIDVGAKFEIYTIINELAAQGKGIIMISSELPELIGESDRIVVMCRGRLTGIVDRAHADEATIMRLATDIPDDAEVVATGV